MSKLKDAIAAQPRDLKRVDVEAFGQKFQMRQLDYGEGQAIRKKRDENPDNSEIPVDWIIACSFDPESGENIFKDTEEDRKLIKSFPLWEIMRLSNVAGELNSSTYKDVAKNSEASPS